jgi:hypothetical protein
MKLLELQDWKDSSPQFESSFTLLTCKIIVVILTLYINSVENKQCHLEPRFISKNALKTYMSRWPSNAMTNSVFYSLEIPKWPRQFFTSKRTNIQNSDCPKCIAKCIPSNHIFFLSLLLIIPLPTTRPLFLGLSEIRTTLFGFYKMDITINL